MMHAHLRQGVANACVAPNRTNCGLSNLAHVSANLSELAHLSANRILFCHTCAYASSEGMQWQATSVKLFVWSQSATYRSKRHFANIIAAENNIPAPAGSIAMQSEET
jgi:hypothetical protein